MQIPLEAEHLIREGAIAALTICLWLMERRERLKLHKQLDDCLKHYYRRAPLHRFRD